MKITKRRLKRIIKEEKQKLVREMNPDGTISGDEDEERDDLLMHIEVEIDNLIQHIVDEAKRIGGQFREAGIRAEAKGLLDEKINDGRLYRGGRRGR